MNMTALSKKAKKVQQYMTDHGFEMKVKELPDSTRTADDAATALGCRVAQIAKSLVFKDKSQDQFVLVIASGENRVNLDKIKTATGKVLVQADGRDIKKRLGFAIGGIPPVAHEERLFTILDPDLKQYENIWAAAGTAHAVFELKSTALEPLTNGIWVDLAE
jgi:prolyl-tRNA editing enzyme YbaK/EbsC (Cys-tRNA(Pro) deacylase)